MNRRKELKRGKSLTAKAGLKRGKAGSHVAGSTPAKPRARRGAMEAAVAAVLAGECTVAQAAREHQVGPGRLDDAAWEAAKLATLERDSYTCRISGERAVDVHHIIRRGIGGTANPVIAFGTANLVSLSRAEHDRCHAKDPELYERGFWRWSTETPGAVPIRVPGPFGSYQPLWLLAGGRVALTDPAEVPA